MNFYSFYSDLTDNNFADRLKEKEKSVGNINDPIKQALRKSGFICFWEFGFFLI